MQHGLLPGKPGNNLTILKNYIMSCETKPLAFIHSATAKDRIAVFTDRKNPALEKKSGKREVAKISCGPAVFLNLLNSLTANGSYDGIRVYFALQEDVLALVFVTTLADPKDKDVHNDDLSNCWIMDLRSTRQIDSKEASDLIVAYEKERLVYFEADGQEVIKKDYLETKSLWYSKGLFGKNGKDGLIDYMECLISNKSINEVAIWFGGFLKSDEVQDTNTPAYQLTLIFQLKGDATGEAALLDDNTDTGVPCPPPNTGCKRFGAKLPL